MSRHLCTVAVRGSKGEALAQIPFSIEQASEPVPEMAYVTDAAGMASVGLPPGPARMRFFLPDGSSQVATVTALDQPGTTYELTLAT